MFLYWYQKFDNDEYRNTITIYVFNFVITELFTKLTIEVVINVENLNLGIKCQNGSLVASYE